MGIFMCFKISKPKGLSECLRNNYELFALIILILLSLGYLWGSNKIESEKLYPREYNEFSLSFKRSDNSRECLEVSPISVYYFEDSSYLRLDTHLEKKCEFEGINLFLFLPNGSYSKGTSEIDNEISPNCFDAEINDTMNPIRITVNGTTMKNDTPCPFIFKVDMVNKFYSDFDIHSGSHVRSFEYVFNNDIWDGYVCENCLSVIVGREHIKRYIPRGDNNIEYEFNESVTRDALLIFNPKMKKYVFIQKILDSVILGLIVVLFFEIISFIVKKPDKAG